MTRVIQCHTCESEFEAKRSDAKYCSNTCKIKKWNNSETKKNNRLIKEYGITLEDRQVMFDAQGGCCAICGRPESDLTGVLQVDHDHTNGAVRELLCWSCNHSIGHFQDDPNLLIAAAMYLMRHQGSNND